MTDTLETTAAQLHRHMTRRLVPVLYFPPPQQDAFFAALDDVDARLQEIERAEWAATFAPPVRTGGGCTCGSVFEARDSQIRLTDEERAAAGDAVADLFGRGPLDELDPAIIAAVVDAVNEHREREDLDALLEWQDNHAYCGDDL